MEFNNKRWREITNEAALNISGKWGAISVISPFGFEVTGNKKSHLSKQLRKFYCYLGLGKNQLHNYQAEVCNDYTESLLNVLVKRDPQFYNDIVILVKNDRFINLKDNAHVCASTDKLLDIQTRTTNDIYEEYANYIIAGLPCLISKTAECDNFDTKVIFRSRAFQLYVMYENLFGHLIANMNDNEVAQYKEVLHLINNSIQLFYSSELMNVPPNNREKEIYEALIKPRITDMVSAVQGTGNNLIEINTTNFHTYTPLSLTLDSYIYLAAKQKLIQTYKDFA